MHETSIAQQILNTVEREARRHQLDCIDSIRLRIGKLASVDVDALCFAIECGLQVKEGVKTALHIEQEDAEARCDVCAQCFSLDAVYDSCPNCGSFRHHIQRGTSMALVSIEGRKNPLKPAPSSIAPPLSCMDREG